MNSSEIKKSNIKKWDEVHGDMEKEVIESKDPIEAAGVGPSISRNYMRGIEDMVEQNDNNFDGVINNVSNEKTIGMKAEIEQEKKSVIEKLKEQPTVQAKVPEKKALSICQELDLQ